MRKVLAAIFLGLALQAAWAMDIGTAKSQGLVGESNNGYLAAVKTPVSAEVQALIDDVNAKRRAEFTSTAAKTGATLEQVRVRFYQLAVERTAPGNYYQDAEGNWQRK